MKTLVIPPGTVYGHLAVIGEAGYSVIGGQRKRMMLCGCECGAETIVPLNSLRAGNTKSCGCRGKSQPDLGALKPGEVPLYGERASGRVALVDVEDHDLVMRHKWYVQEASPGSAWSYAATTIGTSRRDRKHVRMHTLITGYELTDHINHNTLDNRRENLRAATNLQNRLNQAPWRNARSQFKGVDVHRTSGLWRARIRVDGGRRLNLGYFKSEEEAARAYDAAAILHHGEFAYLNFPDGMSASANVNRDLNASA